MYNKTNLLFNSKCCITFSFFATVKRRAPCNLETHGNLAKQTYDFVFHPPCPLYSSSLPCICIQVAVTIQDTPFKPSKEKTRATPVYDLTISNQGEAIMIHMIQFINCFKNFHKRLMKVTKQCIKSQVLQRYFPKMCTILLLHAQLYLQMLKDQIFCACNITVNSTILPLNYVNSQIKVTI